jgi:asparagine synthetase B (glutamine-hydrolysing)
MAIQSNILKQGELISSKGWDSYIDSLKDAAKKESPIDDEKEAAEGIAGFFEEAVKKRLPKKRFGILFSGGVDSTLIAYICKRLKGDFICYTVGIEGSKDLEESQKAAKALGLSHVHKTLALEETEILFQKTAYILGK